MNIEKIALRSLIRHYWKKGLNPNATRKEINRIEGEGSVSKSTVQEWFKKFASGDSGLLDKPRPGRPLQLSDTNLLDTLASDPNVSTRELSVSVGSSKINHPQTFKKARIKKQAPHFRSP